VGALAAAAPRFAGLHTALASVAPFVSDATDPVRPRRRAVHDLHLQDVAVRWPGAADAVLTGVRTHAARGDWLVVRGPS
ncbi:hypothetical protein, partial [Mesorhizobium japonicum]|uniref:hypothetical protein n=1 Tax=Mesorhizobium japonicum TaxID=2066070 RepID=UPI003B5B36E9